MKDYCQCGCFSWTHNLSGFKNLALLNTVGDLYVKRHHPQSRYLDFLPVCFTFDCQCNIKGFFYFVCMWHFFACGRSLSHCSGLSRLLSSSSGSPKSSNHLSAFICAAHLPHCDGAEHILRLCLYHPNIQVLPRQFQLQQIFDVLVASMLRISCASRIMLFRFIKSATFFFFFFKSITYTDMFFCTLLQ